MLCRVGPVILGPVESAMPCRSYQINCNNHLWPLTKSVESSCEQNKTKVKTQCCDILFYSHIHDMNELNLVSWLLSRTTDKSSGPSTGWWTEDLPPWIHMMAQRSKAKDKQHLTHENQFIVRLLVPNGWQVGQLSACKIQWPHVPCHQLKWRPMGSIPFAFTVNYQWCWFNIMTNALLTLN